MTTSQPLFSKRRGKYAYLTAEEERALAERIRAGDKKAQDVLVEAHFPLVERIARQRGKEDRKLFEDLFQTGVVGLLKAIPGYDPSMGRFANYAQYWVIEEIMQYLGNNTGAARIPLSMRRNIKQVNAAWQACVAKYGRPPTDEELSVKAGLPLAIIPQVREARMSLLSVSLTPTSDDGDSADLESGLPDGSILNPEAVVIARSELGAREALLQDMLRAVEELPARTKDIFLRVSGLVGTEGPQTLDVLARKYNVSRERIRQLLKQAWKKLGMEGVYSKHNNSLQHILKEIDMLRECAEI